MCKMFKAVYPIEKAGRCPQQQKLLHSIFFKGSVSPARRIWPREESAVSLWLSVGQSHVLARAKFYICNHSKYPFSIRQSLSLASTKLTFRHTVSLAFVPTEGGYFSGKLKSYNNITLPPQILEMTMKQFLRLLNSEVKQF